MASFSLYGKNSLRNTKVSFVEIVAYIEAKLQRNYSISSITRVESGLKIDGDLKGVFEKAVTKATIELRLEGDQLSYSVNGETKLGTAPWIWCAIGFVSGFGFGVFAGYLIEYAICRDRPKQCIEDAFKAVEFEFG